MNTNLTINNDLNLLAKALRADTFHFILIGHNHPDVYRDVAAWLRTNLPDRRIEELHVIGKRYREVSDALRNAGQDIVLIPDFDSIFLPDNDALRIALNQRRDFLAHQKMNLLCFISPDTFKLLPTKIPDLWSLRSLELDIAYDVKAELFTQKSGAGFTSSLGGTSIAEKEAEIRRLRYQIRQTDPNNSALLNELESQIVTLQIEVPQRFEPEPNVPDTTIANNNESNTTAADKEPTETISETALLSIFAVLPAEPINRTVLHELLSGINNLDATLQNLIKEGLIAFDEKDDSFTCDSKIKETTRQQNGEQLFEHCELLISTLIDKLDYETGTGHFLNSTYEEALIYAKYAESILQHIKKAEENLATLAERLGSFHTTTGNLDKALTFYEDETRLFEELYDAFPSNVFFKNWLAISYEKLGQTHAALGNLDKALTFCEQDAQLTKELYNAFPSNVSFKNGLANAYGTLGQVHTELGNLDKAQSFYDNATRLFEELYDAFPSNVSFKNGLAISYEKLGRTHAALGNLDKALTFYEDETRLFKELYDAFPSNVSFKNGLAISYSKLGQTHDALGNLDKAQTFYEERSRLAKELYEAYSNNVSFKNGLATSYAKLGVFYKNHRSDVVTAHNYFQQAEALWTELTESAPSYVEFKRNLSSVKKDLTEMPQS